MSLRSTQKNFASESVSKNLRNNKIRPQADFVCGSMSEDPILFLGVIMTRRCINCSTEIEECMGACLARDILKISLGIPIVQIREFCGNCSLLRPHGKVQFPAFTAEELEMQNAS